MRNSDHIPLISWPDAPDHVVLSDDDIHVYAANVSDSHEAITTYYNLLSEDEKARAERYIPVHKKQTYAASRVLLRILLSRYLGIPAASLNFSYTDNGKPFLPNHAINFNLSHSGDIALYAFSRNAAVGIDVERLSTQPNVWQTADQFLSTGELTALIEAPASEHTTAFYTYWTCKEAFIKALGETTAISKEFDVALTPDEPRLEAANLASFNTSDWTLRLLEPCRDYLGALAAKDFKGSILKWNIDLAKLIR